jgi:hypothetical protein
MTAAIIIKKRDLDTVIRLLWDNATEWMPGMTLDYDPEEARRFAEAGDCEFVGGRAVGVRLHPAGRGKLELRCSTKYNEFLPEQRVRELVKHYSKNNHRRRNSH